MKTYPILSAVVLASTLLAVGAAAQTVSPTPPADASAQVVNSPSPAATPTVNSLPAPNQVIYIPQLPNPGELVNVAAAQGVSVQQINQTSTQVTIVYKYANGQTNTICYQLLSSAGAGSPTGVPAVGAPAAAPATTTTVVYGTPPSYYPYGYAYPYGYDYPYGYAYPWYGPISLGFSFGYHGGYYHGGYHGGSHGGYRGGFHGGSHGGYHR